MNIPHSCLNSTKNWNWFQNGDTAFHFVCAANNADVASKLLAKAANPYAKNNVSYDPSVVCIISSFVAQRDKAPVDYASGKIKVRAKIATFGIYLLF